MVKINKESKQIEITMQGDSETIYEMQLGILELLRNYDYKNFPVQSGGFYHVINLLESLLPSYEQLNRGLLSDGDHVRIPDNMTSCQRIELTEALTLIEKNPDIPPSNSVFQTLRKIG